MLKSDEKLLEYKESILENTTDGEEGFKLYLASKHLNIISEDMICLYAVMEGFVVLYYVEPFNRRGYTELKVTLHNLYDYYTKLYNRPILFSGKANYLKNNSKEIEDGLWQFIPSYDIIP